MPSYASYFLFSCSNFSSAFRFEVDYDSLDFDFDLGFENAFGDAFFGLAGSFFSSSSDLSSSISMKSASSCYLDLKLATDAELRVNRVGLADPGKMLLRLPCSSGML